MGWLAGWFFDILVILSATVWLLRLALNGYLTVEQTAKYLFGIVVLLGLSRIFNIGMGRLIFRIGIPLVSLYVFAVTYGQGDIGQMTGIIGSVLTLVIVLFGIYIMIVGPFRRKSKR